MLLLHEFKEFPKIPRFNRNVVVTEKIDGTNGLVFIPDDFSNVFAGSKSGWITPENDNHGFAKWVKEHEDELRSGLGPGYHYGEWWGQGIQRRYGLTEKRFSLFNTHRWGDDAVRPKCCHVVPVLASGSIIVSIETGLNILENGGSVAAPGFMRPEGLVIFHTASSHLYKMTLEKDEVPKILAGKAS